MPIHLAQAVAVAAVAVAAVTDLVKKAPARRVWRRVFNREGCTESLYWPDGTIRKRTKSYIAKKSHNRRCLIAQALVDKYNEDYILLKDDAQLKYVLNSPSICENQSRSNVCYKDNMKNC
ncbi:hypothetical protein PVAP13_2NG520100 [Panicum virgatum]|uniref:Uncharacterized protein n=1 Tax=Panicum virgatum TaxID=38727 RepID=A0A8T0VYI3_PANVG|nr:hypothetical protein PVAP13_2NG520100 [Panicum virgatum]KAG2637453.1 hypothetical protein PVAP13_2NG520100 [Panicum virgatum]